MKSLTILGVTGSIGQSTLRLLAHQPGRFRLVALTAAENVEALIQAALTHRPQRAVIANPAHYDTLKEALAGSGIQAAAGEEALAEAAALPSDLVMSAIVGMAGLKPTLAAIKRGATVALANKECLVAAGEFLLNEASVAGAKILPVDSEHNAIFQLLDPAQLKQVSKITLTASGGPFRDWTQSQMERATPAQAVRHPNWSMGAKISVDSATMMNKGLELIEAHRLFGLTPDHYEVLVHPESIVHGMVHYADGSVLAQLSNPDMATPIAHALAWPERLAAPVKPLDLAQLGKLTFQAPDAGRFPALKLARQAMEAGGSAPCVLNAANEVAVGRFLAGEIGFLDIVATVEAALAALPGMAVDSLDAVLACDAEARRYAAG